MGVLRDYGVPEPLLQAIRSLYNQSKSCFHILGTKSNLFTVYIGLTLVTDPVIFMDMISGCSHGEGAVWFRNLRIASLLVADDVVLLDFSSQDLQCTVEQFAAECEAARIKVSSSKSKTMVLNRKKN